MKLQSQMEDTITDIPPPSRFFHEDLNNFAPPSPSLPTPFLVLSDSYKNQPLHPDLLIVAISAPALHIFHHVSSKTLIGTLILPEIPFSGNSIQPTLKDKSCNIYLLDNTKKMVLVVSVQLTVPAERSYSVSKLLLGDQIVPDRVLLLDSIQSQNFRGKLSRDETAAFKLETSLQRKESGINSGDSSIIRKLHYFPSGSVVDGLAAALLAQCQIRNIRGTLCVSWPTFSNSVLQFVGSLLKEDVFPVLEMRSNVGYEGEGLRPSWLKDSLLDSELYT